MSSTQECPCTLYIIGQYFFQNNLLEVNQFLNSGLEKFCSFRALKLTRRSSPIKIILGPLRSPGQFKLRMSKIDPELKKFLTSSKHFELITFLGISIWLHDIFQLFSLLKKGDLHVSVHVWFVKFKQKMTEHCNILTAHKLKMIKSAWPPSLNLQKLFWLYSNFTASALLLTYQLVICL